MKNVVTKDFIAYDYLKLDVPLEQEQLYIDCYESFGWIFTGSNADYRGQADYYINNYNACKVVSIRFKRERKINNKIELITLQKKMEEALKRISRLEKQPEHVGIVWAMTFGVIGLVFLLFLVFLVVSGRYYYGVLVISGLIGVGGLVIPYFLYCRMKSRKQEQNKILIEEQYNVIYDYCEQASKLIN